MQSALYIHVVSICVAFIISFNVLFRAKGTSNHRFFGWCFTGCMLISALSSFPLQFLGWFSPIHLLSMAVIYCLIKAILATRKKGPQWRYNHAWNMGAAYVSIWSAGMSVIVRHLPGCGVGTGYGVIALFVTAAILLPVLRLMTKQYRVWCTTVDIYGFNAFKNCIRTVGVDVLPNTYVVKYCTL